MRRLAVLLTALTIAAAAPVFAQEQAPPLPDGVAPELLARSRDALEAENFGQAVVDLSLYLLLNPTDARGYYLRGLGYYSLDDMNAAIADLTQGLRYSEALPDLQASLLSTRAEFYNIVGDPAAALADVEALIDIRPSSEAYAQRALLRLSGSAFQAAVDDLDEAIMLATSDQPVLFFYRAHAYEALGETAPAAADYLQWIDGISQQTTDEGRLESGGELTLELAPNRAHHIALDVNRGDDLYIRVNTVAGNANPLLVLLGPDGTPLAGNDDARLGRDPSAVLTGYRVLETGVYHLLVSHSIIGDSGRVQVQFEVR